MDFVTTNDTPFPITIDGTAYQIPRFLGPALAAWAEEDRQKTMAEALGELKSEQDRARFRAFFRMPAVDVGRQLAEASSAEGSQYVCRKQMQAAKIPDEVIDKVFAHADPILVRNLAQELTMLPETAAKVDELAGAGKSGETPLTSPPTASVGEASTGPASPEGSTPSTEASTPAQ